MKISRLRITNYRALRDVKIPMSNFGCLIGENNAGKSSILQAISLFFSGTKLSSSDYFESETQVRIEITFEGIGPVDLLRLKEEHRTKIEQLVLDGTLTLVRIYDLDGHTALKVVKLVARDERFLPERVSVLIKGKRGADLVSEVTEVFPELDGAFKSNPSQGDVRKLIEELAESLPIKEKTWDDADLPSGIDKLIIPMLPEPIYIPAVKDLADVIKTTESASFGKLLSILLGQIKHKLVEIEEIFKELHVQLNRGEGTDPNRRLPEVELIETTIEEFVKESFPNVGIELHIPSPELKAILSGAHIVADDGVKGNVESKGDGFKRSLAFAILRAYNKLKHANSFQCTDIASHGDTGSRPYLLLFEEPELYLYPKAQRQLFDALRAFASGNFVVVTTHSPIFFGPQATETFIKLTKELNVGIAKKPFSRAHHVDLRDVKAKDQFQLICHENNNAAFFSETVLLVEGDSDCIVLQHIASILKPEWDFSHHSSAVVRVGGKTSFGRYRSFFMRFNVRVAILADLDVLVNGFEQLGASAEASRLRCELLSEVDRVVSTQTPDETAQSSASDLRKMQNRGDVHALWRKAQDFYERFARDQAGWEELNAAVENFFALPKQSERLKVLKLSDDPSVVRLKGELLDRLRHQDIYVLEHGEIEDYYPTPGNGCDKPTRAQQFCTMVSSREAFLALPVFTSSRYGPASCEFDAIFEALLEVPSFPNGSSNSVGRIKGVYA